MPLPTYRYPLDSTGVNQDNLIVGELHALSASQVRALAPTYGAFFTDSVRVYDHNTGQLLTRGTHYQCVELLQDASMRFGKEICMLLLILTNDVSAEVRINYQVLGGHFQNDATAIVNMYETAIRDQRPIKWENVENRPVEYNPTLHRHLLEDVYGFEPIVAALERVRSAMVLSDVPAFEALMDWVANEVLASKVHGAVVGNPHETKASEIGLGNVENLEVVSESEILANEATHKYLTFDRFLYILSHTNLSNQFLLQESSTIVNEGAIVTINVTTANVVNGTQYYWTIENIDTETVDFTSSAGIFSINSNAGSFTLQLIVDALIDKNETFRVAIHKTSPTGVVVARSAIISVKDIMTPTSLAHTVNAFLLLNRFLFSKNKIKIAAKSLFTYRNNKRQLLAA